MAKGEDDIFESIDVTERKAPYEAKQSIKWLRENARKLIDDTEDITEAKHRFPDDLSGSVKTTKLDVLAIGKMFMYVYDPKWKAKLPYYDTFPLVILTDFVAGGWYGLNLHYVPPFVRKKIIDALSENQNSATRSAQTKLKISYNIMKASSKYSIMQPCFKRYLASQVRSKFLFVDPRDWEKAIMLPTEHFQKTTKQAVHRKFVANNLKGK